jgi:hypothetical protein
MSIVALPVGFQAGADPAIPTGIADVSGIPSHNEMVPNRITDRQYPVQPLPHRPRLGAV